MHALLTQASLALIQNDAAALEAMCVQAAEAAEVSAPLGERERADLACALMSFQRQVLAARSSLVLRRRLLDTAREAPAWVR